jgi:hypothetical protein
LKSSRLRTLLIGLVAGVAYAFFAMLVITANIGDVNNVSIAYIFTLPIVLGAIPVLFSTKEQLQSYKVYLILPWVIVITFFLLCLISGYEGLICLAVIIAPFLLLGTFGAFIFRFIKINKKGKGTKLYASLLLPFIILAIETNFQSVDQYHSVSTTTMIHSNKTNVWNNIKNVKDISPSEIETHFVHLIGVPKPLNGQLDREGIGGIRSITWEKGIKFQEIIKSWDAGNSFSYDIHVDPKSIPPSTLDEHVMIGGKYFDVVAGSYTINQIDENKQLVTLICKYRISTNLNFYSKLWADYLLDDFNKMILEVIKKRSETIHDVQASI